MLKDAHNQADDGALWFYDNIVGLLSTAAESIFFDDGCTIDSLTLELHQQEQARLAADVWREIGVLLAKARWISAFDHRVSYLQ